jgi:hypothetical protein
MTIAEIVPSTEFATPRIEDSPILSARIRDISPFSKDFLQAEVAYRYGYMQEHDPELLEMLQNRAVEGLHGTRSGSLGSILEYGLVPDAEQSMLSQPVITGEHYSRLVPRRAVHLAHWLYPESTIRFAEEEVESDKRHAGITPENYEHVIEQGAWSDNIDERLVWHALFKRRGEAAKRFKEWWESDQPTSQERQLHALNFPVVLGLSLEATDESTISGVHSVVETDTAVAAKLPPQAIKVVFVPEIDKALVHEMVGGKDVTVEALERLRSAAYDPYRPSQ